MAATNPFSLSTFFVLLSPWVPEEDWCGWDKRCSNHSTCSTPVLPVNMRYTAKLFSGAHCHCQASRPGTWPRLRSRLRSCAVPTHARPLAPLSGWMTRFSVGWMSDCRLGRSRGTTCAGRKKEYSASGGTGCSNSEGLEVLLA